MQKQTSFSPKNSSDKSGIEENLLGKRLPTALDAERAVISALLLNSQTIHRVTEFLTASDFYLHQHKLIFQAIIRLTEQNKQVDLVTLQDELAKTNDLEKIGGIVFLVSLQEDIPALGLVEQHARIIKDKSVLRELINAGSQVIQGCYN